MLGHALNLIRQKRLEESIRLMLDDTLVRDVKRPVLGFELHCTKVAEAQV
jgi:hypothetical protein